MIFILVALKIKLHMVRHMFQWEKLYYFYAGSKWSSWYSETRH